MIEVALAIAVSILPLLVGDTTLALTILSSAMVSAPSSCLVICTENIGILFSSSLLGLLLYVVQILWNLSIIVVFWLILIASTILSLIYSLMYKEDKIEEASELIVSSLVLSVVGIMVMYPEAGTEALYGIAGSLWTVTREASILFSLVTTALVVLTSILRDSIVSSIFDREFVTVMGSNILLRYFLMFFISSTGIILITMTLGLFGAQIILTLPTIISLYILRSDISEILPLNFIIIVSTLTAGAYISTIYNVSAIGTSAALMVILIVLLKVLDSIVRRAKPT